MRFALLKAPRTLTASGLFCLASLAAFPASAAAERPVVDFDTLGSDKAAVRFLAPIPPATEVWALAATTAAINGAAARGFLLGPWQPLILEAASHKFAITLRNDPRYGNIPPAVLGQLERDWTRIQNTRGGLLSKASALESDDQELETSGQALQRRRADLISRRDALNAEIGNYNSQCTGRPLPPDEYQACVRWRDDLVRRKAQIDGEIAQFNRDVDAWNAEYNRISGASDVLKAEIAAWVRLIQDLIQNIQGAFDDPEGAETCTLVTPPLVECIYSCPSGETVALPFPVPGEPNSCAPAILHYPRPPANSKGARP